MIQQSHATEPVLPVVSVVIPTLHGQHLAECLRSVSHQDYPRELIQVVIADNGLSVDNVQTLLESHRGSRRIAMGENKGFAAACNRGASEASGEYVAFLNDDAVAEPGWIRAMLDSLAAGGEGAVCAAAHIRSRDGREVEFSGASANVFGVGRPRPVWGWPGSLEPPSAGAPLLFASGGAMLIHRQTFLDAGGFDPAFFAYFEDVDLGWRLWALGHKVVYAPGAVVRHMGGATGGHVGAHRRYTLWECNSLATLVKNYEGGTMEKVLSAALLLLYKRALLSAGDAFSTADYHLSGPRDTNIDNVERLPKVSVAHIAAIDRFNSLLPRFMEERKRIQAGRVRSDAEILPLLGRPFEPQFAGEEYAEAVRTLVERLGLDEIVYRAAPPTALVLAGAEDRDAAIIVAQELGERTRVAVALVDKSAPEASELAADGYALHRLTPGSPALRSLLEQAEILVRFPSAPGELYTRSGARLVLVSESGKPIPAAAGGALEGRLHASLVEAVFAGK